jgi:hypothetical protein
MALNGSQLVNVLASPDGATPYSTSPFPPITSTSPSPQFALLTQQVQSAYAATAADIAAYPTANCRVNVQYWTGNQHQNGYILTSQNLATVQGAF